MITISQRARQMLQSKAIRDKVQITITPNVSGASSIVLPDNKIVESSLCIEKQCSGTTQLQLGTTMYQKLSVQLRHQVSNETALIGSEVYIEYSLIFPDTTEEVIYDGYFYIETANQITPTKLSIVAYDRLTLLERDIGAVVFSGTPFIIFKQINNMVHARVLDTDDELPIPTQYTDLPNVTATVQLSKEESGCNTCRDIVNALAQMMGVFVQTKPGTSVGGLYTYHTDVDLEIQKTNRKDSSHAKYPVKYKQMHISSAKTSFDVPAIQDRPSDGVIFDLGDAPCFDFGQMAALIIRGMDIWDTIKDISYTPAEITMWSDPTIECGDRLKIYADDGNYEMLVTSVTWNYRGSTVVKSAGEVTDKATPTKAGSRQQAVSDSSNKLVQYDVTNTHEIHGYANDVINLCRLTFSSVGDAEVIWLGEALIQAIASAVTVPVTIKVYDQGGNEISLLDSNGNPVTFGAGTSTKGEVKIKIKYIMDAIEQPYYPIDEYLSGDHILSMFYTTQVPEQSAHTWEVWLEVLQGEVVIGETMFRGTLMGQNLLITGDSWDGILTFADTINAVLAETLLGPIQDTSTVTRLYDYTSNLQSLTDYVYKKLTFNENVNAVASTTIVQSATDSVTIELKYGDHILRCGLDNRCGGGRMFGA